jgi:catechol 2,3-dioxygenase-like lactoylglutathione lyase family enzyme
MPATSTMTVTGFSHVGLVVDDLDAALEFYCTKLGFEQLRRPDLGPGAWLRNGAANVHLGVADETRPTRRFAHIALHVPAPDFADTMEELAAQGVEFATPPRVRDDFGTTVWAAVITDPAGNRIELTDASFADAPVQR